MHYVIWNALKGFANRRRLSLYIDLTVVLLFRTKQKSSIHSTYFLWRNVYFKNSTLLHALDVKS